MLEGRAGLQTGAEGDGQVHHRQQEEEDRLLEAVAHLLHLAHLRPQTLQNIKGVRTRTLGPNDF